MWRFFFGIFAWMFFISHSLADGINSEKANFNKVTVLAAQKIAILASKKYLKKDKIACAFIPGKSKTWDFGCHDAVGLPRPGEDLLIFVNKSNGKYIILYGE